MARYGDIASLLRRLVEISGLGEREIATRAGVAVGTLRRYTSGQSIPATYGPLDAIGAACGASEGTLEELCVRWRAQARPFVQLTYAGKRFRGSDDAVGSHFQEKSFCDEVLWRAWDELGRPEPIDDLDLAARDMVPDLVIDALCSQPELRRSVRRRLVSAHHLRCFNWAYPDAEVFARRLDAPLLKMPPFVKDPYELGLMHPNATIAAKAAELVRRRQGRVRERSVTLSTSAVEAAQDEVQELAGEWVAR